MPKTVRVGKKSGVLPKPRQVVPPVHSKYEAELLAKRPNGFEDPAMVPRGSSANPPERQMRSVDERIKLTAKEPKSTQKDSLTETQRWKDHIAQVRRVYFSESLKAYEEAEKHNAEIRQRRHERSEEMSKKLTEASVSEATLLTMPTIESSLLAGSMVQARTEEETETLKLKREQNRLLTKQNQLERLHNTFLELYHSADKFILKKDDLDKHVAKVFAQNDFALRSSSPTSPEHLVEHSAVINFRRGEKYHEQRELAGRQQQLVDALMGTVNNKPGLSEIRDALEGEPEAPEAPKV